jgi:hypothetical protein
MVNRSPVEEEDDDEDEDDCSHGRAGRDGAPPPLAQLRRTGLASFFKPARRLVSHCFVITNLVVVIRYGTVLVLMGTRLGGITVWECQTVLSGKEI